MIDLYLKKIVIKMLDEEMIKCGASEEMYRCSLPAKENHSTTIILIIFLTLLFSSYSIYRLVEISPLYFNSQIRTNVLNSIFYVREVYGVSIADLTIKKVTGNYTIINEYYHGLTKQTIDKDYKVDW